MSGAALRSEGLARQDRGLYHSAAVEVLRASARVLGEARTRINGMTRLEKGQAGCNMYGRDLAFCFSLQERGQVRVLATKLPGVNSVQQPGGQRKRSAQGSWFPRPTSRVWRNCALKPQMRMWLPHLPLGAWRLPRRGGDYSAQSGRTISHASQRSLRGEKGADGGKDCHWLGGRRVHCALASPVVGNDGAGADLS